MKDKVILNLADNPELAEYFSRKSPGDTCELEIKAKLDSTIDDTATLSIESVEYEGDDSPEEVESSEEESSENEAMPMNTKAEEAPPVAIVMGIGKPKKAK